LFQCGALGAKGRKVGHKQAFALISPVSGIRLGEGMHHPRVALRFPQATYWVNQTRERDQWHMIC
jgi:hypothetical protein